MVGGSPFSNDQKYIGYMDEVRSEYFLISINYLQLTCTLHSNFIGKLYVGSCRSNFNKTLTLHGFDLFLSLSFSC